MNRIVAGALAMLLGMIFGSGAMAQTATASRWMVRSAFSCGDRIAAKPIGWIICPDNHHGDRVAGHGILLLAIISITARKPTPASFTHNTPVEVVWTLGPILI